jgi:hypothetical protein
LVKTIKTAGLFGYWWWGGGKKERRGGGAKKVFIGFLLEFLG